MDVTYKIAMQQGDRWNVLDTQTDWNRAVDSYMGYKNFMPHRTFRLEKHTVEYLYV